MTDGKKCLRKKLCLALKNGVFLEPRVDRAIEVNKESNSLFTILE